MSGNEAELPPAKKQKLDEPEPEQGCSYQPPLDIDFTEDVSAAPTESTDSFSMGTSKYDDFVKPEEIEKLKEFQVLDEVKSDDENSDEDESDSSDGIVVL